MSGRRFAGSMGAFLPGHVHPDPIYPEYAQLRADADAAVAADGPFVDPAKLAKVRGLSRSWDWRVAVLGRDGDGTRTLVEMNLLLLADERDLNPPPPQWLLDMRAEAEARDAQRAAGLRKVAEQDEAVWLKARAACPVSVEVRRNGNARPRNGYLHNLGHVVPLATAVSGHGRRVRRHLAGRAVCETESRAKPLNLDGGEGGPATCESCLKIAPQLRPAGDQL